MCVRKETGVKRCLKCGVEFERGRYNGRLEDYGIWMRRKYCSVGCNYIREVNARSSFHRIARQYVKDRCKKCGSKRNLDVHHKDGNWRNNDRSNLETYCHGCHMRLHWRRGDIVGRHGKVEVVRQRVSSGGG